MNMPGERSDCPQAIRWLSWYGVGLASADRLPVVVRIPAGPFGSLKCDPPKGNGRRPQKKRSDCPHASMSRTLRKLRAVQTILSKLEVKMIEFLAEWMVTLLMPASHVLEVKAPLPL